MVRARFGDTADRLGWLDIALDFIGWAMTMVASYGWAAWETQDWIYWSVQTIPQMFNFGYMFRSDGTGHRQAFRDTITGVATLLLSAVYAYFWPDSYCNAPKAKGIVLTGNIFSSMSSICEVPLIRMPGPDSVQRRRYGAGI